MIDAKIKAKDYMVDALVQYKIKKAEKVAYDNAPQSLGKGAVAYAKAAAKAFPPPKDGTKSLKIDDELYKRPIISVKALIKSPKIKEKLRKQLIKHLKMGYNYVVLGYKNRGKHQVSWYSTQRQPLKDKTVIKYRGLYKWLWGANLDKIGEKTPIAFRRLQEKAPQLAKKKDLAPIKLQKKESSIAVVIDYLAEGIDFFVNIGNEKGLRSSMNKIKSFLNKKIKKEIKNV